MLPAISQRFRGISLGFLVKLTTVFKCMGQCPMKGCKYGNAGIETKAIPVQDCADP
jgi:hypothetical protein